MLETLASLIFQGLVFYAVALYVFPSIFRRTPTRALITDDPAEVRRNARPTPFRRHGPVRFNPSPSYTRAFSNSETEDEAPYCPRTLSDVEEVGRLISRILLPELSKQILENAEYWIRERTEKIGDLAVSEARAGIEYLRSGPLGRPPLLGASDSSVVDMDEGLADSTIVYRADGSRMLRAGGSGRRQEMGGSSEAWDLSDRRRGGRGPVKKVIMTLRSHDQGWSSDNRIHHGTYHNSWTWFEVTVIPTPPASGLSNPTSQRHDLATHTSSEAQSNSSTSSFPLSTHISSDNEEVGKSRQGSQNIIPPNRRRYLQHNLHAHRQSTLHTIRWEANTPADNDATKLSKEAEWVRSLQFGEEIVIEAWARYGGWSNHVEAARIDVFLEGWS